MQTAAAVVLIAAAVFILYRFPPDRYGFYPRCPVYSLFGIHCPGCGMTRAAARLIRGDFTGAARLNIFCIPLALLSVFMCLRKSYAVLRWSPR